MPSTLELPRRVIYPLPLPPLFLSLSFLSSRYYDSSRTARCRAECISTYEAAAAAAGHEIRSSRLMRAYSTSLLLCTGRARARGDVATLSTIKETLCSRRITPPIRGPVSYSMAVHASSGPSAKLTLSTLYIYIRCSPAFQSPPSYNVRACVSEQRCMQLPTFRGVPFAFLRAWCTYTAIGFFVILHVGTRSLHFTLTD